MPRSLTASFTWSFSSTASRSAFPSCVFALATTKLKVVCRFAGVLFGVLSTTFANAKLAVSLFARHATGLFRRPVIQGIFNRYIKGVIGRLGIVQVPLSFYFGVA
jgi:hypothetical protein